MLKQRRPVGVVVAPIVRAAATGGKQCVATTQFGERCRSVPRADYTTCGTHSVMYTHMRVNGGR